MGDALDDRAGRLEPGAKRAAILLAATAGSLQAAASIIHGTARWASARDVRRLGLTSGDGVVLGQAEGRIGALEQSQETLFELSSHSARFAMSVAPEIPDPDKAAISARGSQRLRNVIAAVIARLKSGRSAWRDHFLAPAQPTDTHPRGAAAE